MPPLSAKKPVTLKTPPQKSGGAGAVFGTIIIVIMMIFGALYLYGAWLNKNSAATLPVAPDGSIVAQQ